MSTCTVCHYPAGGPGNGGFDKCPRCHACLCSSCRNPRIAAETDRALASVGDEYTPPGTPEHVRRLVLIEGGKR